MFRQLVKSKKDKLFRFAKWMLQNEDDAKDIVQDVFIKAWKMKSKFSEIDYQDGYLMKMTKNLCLNKLKSDQRFISDKVMDSYSHSETPEKKAELNSMVDTVSQIISKLPLNQKLVIELREIEGFSLKEISETLDLKIEHVRVLISRARIAIKEEYLKVETL